MLICVSFLIVGSLFMSICCWVSWEVLIVKVMFVMSMSLSGIIVVSVVIVLMIVCI